MDQDKTAPQEPPKPHEPETPPAGKTEIDLDKILLPKKEVHDPANAQRINAGALLEQEQNATLAKPQAATENGLAERSEEIRGPFPGQLGVKPEESIVRPIETYQGDIEKLVQQKNVSVVSIAAAEAVRRSQTAGTSGTATTQESVVKKWGSRAAMILGGLFLLLLAVLVLAFVYSRTRPLTPLENAPDSPFIFVDETLGLELKPNELSRTPLMTGLENERKTISLSLGLMERIFLALASTTDEGRKTYVELGAQKLVSTLAPSMPQELLRTIKESPYLFGIHSFDGNQPFLIVNVDSYQQAFSGMLAWESTMATELAPLFSRIPRARIPEENIATSTPPVSQIFNSRFVDRVVENRDSRAILNESGDILLLWTFLDRNTIVITTNEYTLKEIISRFASVPANI